MKLKDCLEPNCSTFQTDFEIFSYSKEELEQSRYEVEMNSLVRVVRKSFVDDLEEIGCSDLIYLCMLPTHAEDILDNYLFNLIEDNPEEIKNNLSNIFSSTASGKMSDDNSTSFFITQSCFDEQSDRQSAVLNAKLKDIVTKGTEEITLLRGNISFGSGVFHKSKKFQKPNPKTKHISFWKKYYKQGITFESLYNIFVELKI